MFRKLRADEIEVRVGGVTENKGGFLLLYKDARCDMRILDETLGATNWTRTHEEIDGQLFCNVSIWDSEKSQWITKQDVGVESFSDSEKGRASDSFKRACFNLGIGRELYTAPFIWISDQKANKTNWKYKKFIVREIGYDEKGNISKLVILEQKGFSKKEVYKYSNNDSKETQEQKVNRVNKTVKEKINAPNNQVKNTRKTLDKKGDSIEQEQIEVIMTMAKDLKIDNDELKKIMKKVIDKETFKGMTQNEYQKLYAYFMNKTFDVEIK